MSSSSYILQIMLLHQSLKIIHYRTILIFQNKKTTDLRVKYGGDKRHVPPPPHVKTCGGYISPPSPPGIYALGCNCRANIFGVLRGGGAKGHKPKRYSKLKLFFEFPTISIICLINIDKYYKICTFLKKSCINFQNFLENVINDLYSFIHYMFISETQSI